MTLTYYIGDVESTTKDGKRTCEKHIVDPMLPENIENTNIYISYCMFLHNNLLSKMYLSTCAIFVFKMQKGHVFCISFQIFSCIIQRFDKHICV